EASKFTEVGYVGRDCESMVRDLTDIAVAMVKEEKRREVLVKAEERAEERLIQLLVPESPMSRYSAQGEDDSLGPTRKKFRERLREGKLDSRKVEVEVDETRFPSLEMYTPQGVEEVGLNLQEMIPNLFGRRQRQTVSVAEAREILRQQEAEKLIDQRQVSQEARGRVEQGGLIFLDEIDKVAVREGGSRGPDVSREGVQRDLLPIVEGTTVTTKYGLVKTDHILFIAAGAFHLSKPSDLIPELQGRLPIRVELDALGQSEFVRILTEPEASLTKQYQALMRTEGLEIELTEDAVEAIARLAVEVNSRTENIGARRLATLMERLLETISFEAPEMEERSLIIDAEYVENALADIVKDEDMSRYVL
ncbi:MAG: ATP-dependent protease ATPase subunit HslU, partial [Holophagales bacterium]|nr:ATP-dependent protease ATPase subunit HslU [Holophagales bacterium]